MLSGFKRFTIINHIVHPMQKTTYRMPERGYAILPGEVHKNGVTSPCFLGEAIDRLGQYEDLELSPEQLSDLIRFLCK